MTTVQKLRESTDAILAQKHGELGAESLRADFEHATNLGREIGRFEIRQAVHAWVMKHADELSLDAMRDLFISVGIRKP